MTKEQVKRGLESAAPYLVASAVNIPFVLDGDVGVNGTLLAANFGVSALLFYLKCRQFIYLDTPEYKEYVDLYEEFILDIAKMYKELGFKGDFSTSIVLKQCLDSGIFSEKPVKYTVYQDDADRMTKYSGGRVTTGSCCCRHSASFMADVLTATGGVAPKISVYFGDETDEKKIHSANHVVTGTLLNDKKVIIDPTVNLLSLWHHGIYQFDSEYKGKMTTAKSLDETRFYLMDSVYAKETDKGKSLKKFMKCSSDIDEEELMDAFLDGTLSACRYNDEFIAFHNDEKKKILQLSRLSSVVAPHGIEKE